MNDTEKVIAVRKETGLDQGSFGERIGYTQSMISKFERGLRPIQKRAVISIVREFGVSVAWWTKQEGPILVGTTQEPEFAELLKYLAAKKDLTE